MKTKKYDMKKDLEFNIKATGKFIKCSGMGFTRDKDGEVWYAGKKVKLICDQHNIHDTFNFFIEKYSHGKVIGGPWQAQKKGYELFVYYFYPNDTYYVFKTDRLVEKLDSMGLLNADLKTIENGKYKTRGWKVVRLQLKDIYIEKEFPKVEPHQAFF